MKITQINLTTKDHLLLDGLVYSPDQPTKKAVLHFHRMAGSFYDNIVKEMSDEYTDRGISLVTIGTRGHDIMSNFPTDLPEEEYIKIGNAREIFEDSVHDIEATVTEVLRLGFTDLTLQGHSLGSAKVVYYLTRMPDAPIKRLLLLSPPDMIYRAEAQQGHDRLMRKAQTMVDEGRGEELMPEILWDWYHLSAKTYLNLNTRGNPVDIFNIHAPDEPSPLGDITVPILATYGSKDEAIGVPAEEAMAVLKRKAVKCPRFDSRVIDGAPHTYYNHQREVARVAAEWLAEQ